MIALKISTMQWRGLITGAGWAGPDSDISHLLSLLRRDEELRPVDDEDVGSGGGGLSLAVEH